MTSPTAEPSRSGAASSPPRTGAGSHSGGGLWSDTLRPFLARAGLATEGALYVVIGLLTIEIASGNRKADTGATGAIETIAVQPYGQWLLGILAAGLFALAAWRVTQAVTGDPVEGDETSDRIGFALRAVVYVGLGAAATATLVSNSGSSSGSPQGSGGSGSASASETTAVVMDLPAGRFLVAVAALAFIGGSAYAAWKHTWNVEFRERLRTGEMSSTTRKVVVTLGRLGYLGRSVAFAVVGVFLLEASISYDASEAKGLSASLKTLAGSTWGLLVLWLVAIGLMSFGVYRLADARYRRVS